MGLRHLALALSLALTAAAQVNIDLGSVRVQPNVPELPNDAVRA